LLPFAIEHFAEALTIDKYQLSIVMVWEPKIHLSAVLDRRIRLEIRAFGSLLAQGRRTHLLDRVEHRSLDPLN
jgi:hypothetical protein